MPQKITRARENSCRSGDGDKDALPAGLREVFVVRPGAFFHDVVARHADVAAERERAQPVVGVAALYTEQPRAETEGENIHADAAELRGDEVAPLVHENHDAEDDG